VGKGSRQRPTAKSYQDNYDKIFGKQKQMVMSEKELLLSENLRLRIENEALKLEVERLTELHWFW